MSDTGGQRFGDSDQEDEDDLNGLRLAGHLIYPELVIEILSHVPDLDLLRKGRLVCRKWRTIIDENGLWKRKAQRRGHFLPHRIAAEENHPWPTHTYRNIAMFNPFGKNLIENPCGERGNLQGWLLDDSIRQGGWRVEDPPCGADSLAEVDQLRERFTSCFATTYYPCRKWQVVDLAARGCSAEMMAALNPDIYVCEWFAARFDCGSKYQLDVELQDEAHTIVDRFEFDHQEPQWTGSRWSKVEHTFKRPPSSVRYVRFRHFGQDTQFWAGHYGSKMTGATVLLILDGTEEEE